MRLLIIGSLNGYISKAGQIAKESGADVSHVEGVPEALKALRSGQGADLILVDVIQDIAGLIKSLESERIHAEIVACGVEMDPAAAEKAIKSGAKEYIPLPPDPELIAAVLAAVTEDTKDFIFKDDLTKQRIDMARQIAPSEASVLITGENGTGKEVMARFIHTHSKRAEKKFVAINCAAIPDNLLESELFGHEKGAFTGALARRIGKFEEANGGTLLLDEISEMDTRLQAKLLRVIQEREISRVGGSDPVKVDIRLLATSNRNLQESVKKGEFREDLYFRLNVVNVEMPALRDRPEDISILADFFSQKYANVNGVPERPISDAAVAKLKNCRWNGNVRELENCMHRAVLMASGSDIDENAIMLTSETLKESASDDTTNTVGGQVTDMTDAEALGTLVGRTVEEVERELIIDTLGHTLGNRTHAANILGISIRTLRNKLKQYTEQGIDIPAVSGE